MTLPTNLPTDFVDRGPAHTAKHIETNVRVNAIATEVNAHEVATDPHGDRAYTDTAVAAVGLARLADLTAVATPGGVYALTVPTAGQFVLSAIRPLRRSEMTSGTQGSSASSSFGTGTRGHRVPYRIPARTSRWRVRIRNYDAVTPAALDPVTGLSGLVTGEAATATDGTLNGSYAAGTTTTIATGGDYTIPGDGTWWVSDWVTDSAVQLDPGKTYLLTSGNSIVSGTKLVGLSNGVQWNLTGGSVLDPTTAPGSSSPSQGRFAHVVEYEAAVGACVAFLGDSLVEGFAGARQPLHLSWPHLWAGRNAAAAVNLGVTGRTLANWANNSHALWSQIVWTDYTFDAAWIAAGTNDIVAGTDLATMQTNFLAALANLRSRIGATKPVYASTILPRKFGTTNETIRTGFNTWLASLPGKIAGISDLAGVLTDPTVAAPPQILPTYTTDDTHPTPLGYQRLADVPALLVRP